jgi:hypothetical protein
MKCLIGHANIYTYRYRNEHIAVLLPAVLFTMALLAHAGTAIADKGIFPYMSTSQATSVCPMIFGRP